MIIQGVVLILIGLVAIYPLTMEGIIKVNNTMRGSQTKITSGTKLAYRIFGTFLILLGILFLLPLFV